MVQVWLWSLVYLKNSGFSFNCSSDGLDFFFYRGNVFGHATLKHDFLLLDLDDRYNNCSSICVAHCDFNLELIKWHAKLGHIGQERMSRWANEGLLYQLTKVKLHRCESYLACKATAKLFAKAPRASRTLELIHSNICGPMNVNARHEAFNFLAFMDVHSRHKYVHLLSHHCKAFDMFKRFVVEIETLLEWRVKPLRTNRDHKCLW